MHALRSPHLPDVTHGFSTRQGGVSTGRYASLNLGASWGDDPAAVTENRRRLAEAGGFDLGRLVTTRQVHGRRCLTVPADGSVDDAGADALATTTPGVALGVFTADCVPVLLSDGAGGVAAAHAGWRGLVAGVLFGAVASLAAAGGRPPTELRACIGPSIGPCCFEVGEEVAAQFPVETVLRGANRPRIDLRGAAMLQLTRAGLAAAKISSEGSCTRCDAERFFSFRRDGAGIGQMLSFIVAG